MAAKRGSDDEQNLDNDGEVSIQGDLVFKGPPVKNKDKKIGVVPLPPLPKAAKTRTSENSTNSPLKGR